MNETQFPELGFRNFYSGPGRQIVSEFVKPALAHSISYDRLTGYFNVNSLIAVGDGLDSLFRGGGRMRLVIGIHDVPGALLASVAMGEILPVQLVEEYKKRLFEEAGFIESEAQKHALVVFGWMMQVGMLEVSVAAPRGYGGIFHQKRMIFRDRHNNVIAGTGSLNETVGGHSNVEEMYFQFSWQSPEIAWKPFIEDFESIWNGNSAAVSTHRLDLEFAGELLGRLGNPPNPLSDWPLLESDGKESASRETVAEFVKFLQNSPSLAMLNVSTAVLYPHQERVFRDGLSDWPIRKLLADEVGLGKTLEAGSIISYLRKYAGIETITILCPAGLMVQWQAEMQKHFGLDFWCWRSAEKSYISPDGKTFTTLFAGQQDFNVPSLRIVSAQWARLHETEFAESLPQMLIVDEAHAARTKIDQYGVRRTKFWRLLDNIKFNVQHLLLLTATPMQVQPIEFHGLLEILGISPFWSDFETYMESLEILGNDLIRPTMQVCSRLAQMIDASISRGSLVEGGAVNNTVFGQGFVESSAESPLSQALYVKNNFQSSRKLLMELHPGHRLTIRNTKAGLEPYGYRFPERVFSSPKVELSGSLTKYEAMVDEYLTSAYGRAEAAAATSEGYSAAFARSNYYQRLVSSLYASHKSLSRRLRKIEDLQDAAREKSLIVLREIVSTPSEADELDFSDDLDIASPTEVDLDSYFAFIVAECQVELAYIRELLQVLDSLTPNAIECDPKLTAALTQLQNRLQVSSVLVFSKYTDTIEGFLQYFEQTETSRTIPGFALYTGQEIWIESNHVRHKASKVEVTDALANGEIQVVFCSDAASEGLNLQTSRVIINLDVPWNPARLEQRIGRIARLGQTANSVEIINLWYPKSIEAKMYRRLLSRRDDYQLAVGEFPEIFSEAIAAEVRGKLSRDVEVPYDPISTLREMRRDTQRKALAAIWNTEVGDVTVSELFRAELINSLSVLLPADFDVEALTNVAGSANSLSLLSSIFNKLRYIDTLEKNSTLPLVLYESEGVPLYFAIRVSESVEAVLNISAIPQILLAIYGAEPLNQESVFGVFGMSSGVRATNPPSPWDGVRMNPPSHLKAQENNFPKYLSEIGKARYVGEISVVSDFREVANAH